MTDKKKPKPVQSPKGAKAASGGVPPKKPPKPGDD